MKAQINLDADDVIELIKTVLLRKDCRVTAEPILRGINSRSMRITVSFIQNGALSTTTLSKDELKNMIAEDFRLRGYSVMRPFVDLLHGNRQSFPPGMVGAFCAIVNINLPYQLN